MTNELDIINYIKERVCEALRVRINDNDNCAMELNYIIIEHNSVMPVTINPIWMLDYILASSVIDILEENRERFIGLDESDKTRFIDAIESSFEKLTIDYNDFFKQVSESKMFDMDEIHLKFKEDLKEAIKIVEVK